ncbi:MAG: LD-carboxypeptidase [Planctomycetota bacterium]
MERRFPKALQAGDEVAVITPASGVRDEAALARGLERFRALGWVPTLMPYARGRLAWPEGCPVAATDAQRLGDLQAAIRDPRYRAIVCARGGYGAARLLPDLDLSPLASDPKPILGYSDITALLAAAYADVGLVSFHGPMLATADGMDAGEGGWRLQAQLLSNTSEALALPAADGARGVCQGVAEGPLVGGNLALVQSLIGTRWEVDTRGALLFLEDTGEPPYRVDRMLTQLLQTGAVARAAGVVLGDFHVPDTPLASEHPGMVSVLEERLAGLRIPVARGFPIGHLPGAWTVPFGGRARLSVPAIGAPATLELLEPCARG